MRSYIFIFGQVIFTLLGVLLTYHYGILGLAYAQVIQGVFLIVAGYFVVGRILHNYSIFEYKYSKAILRKMLGYGFNVQVSTLFMSMLDPITKVLIIKFGGAASAGYFEIANQIVSRARAFITSANQAVIPYIAFTNFGSVAALSSFYLKNIRIVAYIALPLLGGLVLWSHPISSFILGAPRIEFFYMFLIVAAGWMINLISSPAYFINQGSGDVRLNTIAIGIMSALNIFLGLFFGYIFGALGTVAAYAIAIASGSVFLLWNKIYSYGFELSLRFSSYGLLFWSYIGATLIGSLFWITPENSAINYLLFVLSNLLLIYSVYRHPLYVDIIGKISCRFRRGM
jgi:O-antigen/teichoic acid export membrane protein